MDNKLLFTIAFHQLKTLPPAVNLPKTRLRYLDGISGFFVHVFLGKSGASNTLSWAHHLRSRGLVFGASNASKPEAFQPSSTSKTQGGLSAWWFKVSIPKVLERDENQSAFRDVSTPLNAHKEINLIFHKSGWKNNDNIEMYATPYTLEHYGALLYKNHVTPEIPIQIELWWENTLTSRISALL